MFEAVIGGAANIGSSIINNIASHREAGRMMDFQERMSSTSHTREVADLKRAGLNPILSANSGASSPAGAMGPMTAPQIDLPAIFQAKQLELDTERLGIDKANSAASIAKTLSDRDLNRAKTITEKNGIFNKWLGQPGGALQRGINKGFQEMKKNPLFNQQPLQTGPSSGGSLP